MFVTWIRANLKVNVGLHLWDKCLEVFSSLTHWEEIVAEWLVRHLFVFARHGTQRNATQRNATHTRNSTKHDGIQAWGYR